MNGERGVWTRRSMLARCLVLAWAVGAILGFGPTSSAHAGTYRVYECNPGQSSPGASDAHVVDQVGNSFPPGIDCSPTSGFGLGLLGNPSAGGTYGDTSTWELRAPTGTLIRNMQLWWKAASECGAYSSIEARNDSGTWEVRAPVPYTDFFHCNTAVACPNARVQDGYCPLSNSGLLMDARNVVMSMYCGSTSIQTCVPYGGSYAYMKDLDITLEDLQRPSPPTVGGSLVTGGLRRGTESLTVAAADSQTGVAGVDIYINGSLVAHRSPTCPSVLANGRAGRFQPCQPTANETFAVATDVGPWHEGTNRLQACATDYANEGGVGNEKCSDVTVDVDNSCDDSVGTTVATNLDAGLAVRNETPKVNTVVTSNDSVMIKGTVRTSSGGPVAGANVCVYERIATRGEDRALADIVHSKSNGSFTSSVDAGPSRAVYVDYRYSNLVLEKQLQLDSTAQPNLKIRKRQIHNGHSMHFKGTIPGPYNARRVVVIQAQVGRTWRTFKQVTTDQSGEFKGSYTFKHSTLPSVKYTFRAVVTEQDGYPFKTGISNKAKVVVKG